MEWGKFPIYLTLKCINIFFAIIWLCHSDECQWEMVGYVIQTTVRRKNLLFCVREEPSFHTVTNTSSFVVSRSSIHTVCDKLSERLCHLRKWLCQTSETVVQSAWHSCAKGLSQSCQRRGTSMPKAWHEQGILTKGLLSSSQAGITAWYGWQ